MANGFILELALYLVSTRCFRPLELRKLEVKIGLGSVTSMQFGEKQLRAYREHTSDVVVPFCKVSLTLATS